MRVLVTGAAGFIGSNLLHHLCALPAADIVAVDALTYAGNRANLEDIWDRIGFVHADVRDAPRMREAMAGCDAVIHLAAESHVDRSIRNSRGFVDTNVLGTQVLLEVARAAGIARFIQVSTDEVYGALGSTGAFTEASPVAPRSPYAASKASADMLALAYHHTYGLPVIITRCTNNYGPYQFPEKLIPQTVVRALSSEIVPVYGDGSNVRDWIHVDDHCRGILAALHAGRPGSVYNLGASEEHSNLEVVRRILDLVGAPQNLIRFVADRPGHDFRYAIDATLAREALQWRPERGFADGLAETVRWYMDHRAWWTALHAREGSTVG